ncbi:transposase [Streptomyces sp. NPDC012935]|uniref:transposase n=1 Tax=Streptomyces sp. NPDC012935 TaxID=3364857 RepID=UPI003681E33E
MPQSSVSMAGQSSSVAVECDCLAHRLGNAADRAMRERQYPTDMTEAEWAVVRPLLPVPGWLRGRGGQPEAYCHRTMLDALRYLVDNGIKWRAMPADFPPWDRVYAFFRRWRDHALIAEFHDRLRAQARIRTGRDAEPTAGVIDSQSIKADAVVGADSRGYDGSLVECCLAALTLVLAIVKRSDDMRGFVVLPKRWIAERFFSVGCSPAASDSSSARTEGCPARRRPDHGTRSRRRYADSR